MPQSCPECGSPDLTDGIIGKQCKRCGYTSNYSPEWSGIKPDEVGFSSMGTLRSKRRS